LTHILLTSVNLELPSKSQNISRKGKWTISWPDMIVVIGWGVGTFFLMTLRNESHPFALEITNPFFTCHLNVRRSS
jgi:hypothetical protein